MERLILFGSGGRFGRDATKIFQGYGYDVVLAPHHKVDITNWRSLQKFASHYPAKVWVNAAAYTDVDGAEEERRKAASVNQFALSNLATMCNEREILLVHISTDFVFPGTKKEGYDPSDAPGPAVNYYGETKLYGERILQNLANRYIIARTQGLYGDTGTSFVKSVYERLQRRETVTVPTDQWGVPTYAEDLADMICQHLRARTRGVIHCASDGGPVSRYQVALAIAQGLDAPKSWVVGKRTEELPPAPAKRPEYSWLRPTVFPGMVVRDWRAGLYDWMRRKKERANV